MKYSKVKSKENDDDIRVFLLLGVGVPIIKSLVSCWKYGHWVRWL
jgi:hypothetical protein